MEHDLRTNFSFSADEHRALMLIFQQSLGIHRQTEMFLWLQGDMQRFIPHETLIAARGDIHKGQLSLNVVSSLPSLHGDPIASKELATFTQRCFDRWKENRYHPVVIGVSNGFGTEDGSSECNVMQSLKKMRSVVIHGIEGARGESDRMYMAFHSETHPDPIAARRMTELILPFIDVTLCRVARSDRLPEYRLNHGDSPDLAKKGRVRLVSARTRNHEVGALWQDESGNWHDIEHQHFYRQKPFAARFRKAQCGESRPGSGKTCHVARRSSCERALIHI